MGTKGVESIKSCVCLAYSERRDVLFGGHADGHISACNFAQKRQCAAWLAHPHSQVLKPCFFLRNLYTHSISVQGFNASCFQVIGLAVAPWKAVAREVCLISQGRDGKIRFWDTDLTLSPSMFNFFHDFNETLVR